MHDPSLNLPPSAALAVGDSSAALHGTPLAEQTAVPLAAGILLGRTCGGVPVRLAATSLEWLDDLEAAIQIARARGIIEAGMTVRS